MSETVVHSMLSDFDIDLFKSGKHFRMYEKLGAHLTEVNGEKGVYFAVYAPAALEVNVIGDFNFWKNSENALHVRWDGSGIWEGFIPGVQKGTRYKYAISSEVGEGYFEKGDPYARRWETPPNTASIIWEDNYKWKDSSWMKSRKSNNSLKAPWAIYELHPGSWRWNSDENRPLTWLEMAEQLPEYAHELGFTHVEFMPVMEYPYDPSWGYQLIGYFAPTSRFGSPEDFKFLVDALHRKGIGVILDWVPSHFPEDAHGLGKFDGTAVYEHPDPKRGFHPDWKSLIFNYGRAEVRSFLISNALFWLDQFHVDGLRVDAVASMLYLDYSREEGEWDPNEYGGRENLEAISFMKDLNVAVYGNYPDVQTIAEESTAFPQVTKPTDHGGLGFGMKWMMGWMHDSLSYFQKDPIHRQYHQNEITFSLAYVFTENFMLPLSHDEVVHGKKSMLDKMPGDTWQKLANLRLFYSLMYAHPGAKLIFMGGEFGQWAEWDFSKSLDWHLTEEKQHSGIQKCISSLNTVYKKNAAFYDLQFSAEGFEWIDFTDSAHSVFSFIRKTENGDANIIAISNCTPTPQKGYRLGIPGESQLSLIFNSDEKIYGGSGFETIDEPISTTFGWHGRPESVQLDLPPLSCLYYVIKTPN